MGTVGWMAGAWRGSMTMIVVSIDLPHAAPIVWAELSQLEKHLTWMADAERIDFATEQTRGVGVTMAVRTRIGPLVTTDVIEVWEWAPGERIGVFHRGIVSGIGMFVLVPIETGTRFVWWEELSFPWFLGGGIAAWLARPVLRLVWRKNLRRFSASLS